MKADVLAAGRRWGPKAEREFCHGGRRPEEKGPRDGCAYLWPTWHAVPYYAEQANLIEHMRKPAPADWGDREYRLAYRIRGRIKELQLAEMNDERDR